MKILHNKIQNMLLVIQFLNAARKSEKSTKRDFEFLMLNKH